MKPDEKPTIQFNKATLRTVISLDKGRNSACAEFLEACLNYDDDGVVQDDFKHDTAAVMFTHARPQLDTAMEQYIRMREQRKAAARKRWEKEKQLE